MSGLKILRRRVLLALDLSCLCRPHGMMYVGETRGKRKIQRFQDYVEEGIIINNNWVDEE